MSRTSKIILLILVFLGLSLSVFLASEEITAFKRAIHSRFSKDPDTTVAETEPSAEDAEFAEMYASFPAFAHKEDAWYQDTRLVYHAGGGVDGLSYTNSREAVEATLPHGKVLEIDFFYTADRELVCIHSWPYITGSEEPMTAEEYKDHKIFGKYTTMSAEDMLALMKEDKDLYIVIDTKEDDAVSVIRDLMDLAGNEADVVDRFIIQLYEKGVKARLLEVYPFAEENFLFTCYKYGTDPTQILRICMEEGISVVTVEYGTWSADTIDLFTQKGILIFEHTVNRPDHVQKALDRGVYGVYTDFLTSLDP